MRAAILSAGLLLTVSLAALAAPGATALTGGCDGVVVSSEFTGHCGDTCNGTVYLNGNRWADHTCPGPIVCYPDCEAAAGTDGDMVGTDAAALLGGCDGVTFGGTFTGHCGDLCNGSVYVRDIWMADHYCTNLA